GGKTERRPRPTPSDRGRSVTSPRAPPGPRRGQPPPPPILVAGNGPRVAERVIAYGDEWIPMLRPGVLDHIAEFRRTARKPGSDRPIPVTLFGGEPADVDAYQRAGVDRCLFWPRPMDPQNTTRLVDRIALALGPRLSGGGADYPPAAGRSALPPAVRARPGPAGAP